MTSYKRYETRVRRAKQLFSCESVSRKPTDHAKHVYEDHGLNKKTHCPWCRQPFDTGFKGVAMNVSHLSECFDRFENLNDVDEEPSDVEPLDVDEEPKDSIKDSMMCERCIEFDSLKERCRFYGRSRLDHPTFYEPFEHQVCFTDASGLGADVARYIGLEGHVFVHFFVKLNAFDSFTEAMRDSRSVHLLPFSCLCDGGNCREDEYRIHRHGIAVCRELKDFTDMFSRVRFTTRKHKDQKCKSYVKIKSRHHLCNTINYVSGRKSGCTGKSLHKSKKSSKKNHFHIFRPLCPHANLFLHACYDAGPQEYYEQLHGNRDVWDKEVKWEDGKAYILVSELPSDGCSPPPDLFGRPISRYREDLRFFLTKPQKRVARELEMDRAKNEKEKQAMRSEKDSEIAKLRSENEKLRSENEKLRSENEKRTMQDAREVDKQTMQEKDREIQQKDFKIERLQSENDNLRKELDLKIGYINELMALKVDFNRQMNELRAEKDAEIKSLRAEKDAEIKNLRAEKDEEIKNLRAEKDAEIKRLCQKLEERDAEIKRLLVDQLDTVVKQNLEDVNLREENRQSLIEHHAKIVRLMEEKMELKDKICALFERVVCTWLADSKKRKLCTN